MMRTEKSGPAPELSSKSSSTQAHVEALDNAEPAPPADGGGLEMLGRAPQSFKLVYRLAERIQWGTLVFVLPDGRAIRFQGRAAPQVEGVLTIRDYRFARRLLFGGGVGFFEAFADDQWDSPDLATLLHVLAQNMDRLQDAVAGHPLARFANSTLHAFHRNSKRGSKRNIMAHYDLGNEFYRRWLDRTMTYSSARFSHDRQGLADAQTNKYRELAHRIQLKEGESVLEIGSGWGGFAEFAAKEIGARVTGITISPEQYEFARRRLYECGLSDRAEIRLQDYRDVEEKFDKAASIEMFEAVGAEYWPTYFGKLREVLKPGGLAGLQIITISDKHFPAYRKTADFIQRYVFPGGMLPSPSVLRQQIESAGLAWRGASTFGRDYALTLSQWHERFLAAWNDIRTMGFDERFKKLWRYYLAYCEAGFRARTIDVAQVTVARA